MVERREPSQVCDFCQKKIGPSESTKSQRGWMSCHRFRCQQLMEWNPPKPGWIAPKSFRGIENPPPLGPLPIPVFGLLPPALARNTDPDTSHDAAEAVTRSSSRASHCNRLEELIRDHPGCIVPELEELYEVPIGKHDMTKRVADLIRLKRAEWRGNKINPETNCQCGRLYIVKAAS